MGGSSIFLWPDPPSRAGTGVHYTPIFATLNWLTVPLMHCSISQEVWVVGLPFCEGISQSRAQNTPRLFRGQSCTCSGLSAASLAAWQGLIQWLPWQRACAITLPNGQGE